MNPIEALKTFYSRRNCIKKINNLKKKHSVIHDKIKKCVFLNADNKEEMLRNLLEEQVPLYEQILKLELELSEKQQEWERLKQNLILYKFITLLISNSKDRALSILIYFFGFIEKRLRIYIGRSDKYKEKRERDHQFQLKAQAKKEMIEFIEKNGGIEKFQDMPASTVPLGNSDEPKPRYELKDGKIVEQPYRCMCSDCPVCKSKEEFKPVHHYQLCGTQWVPIFHESVTADQTIRNNIEKKKTATRRRNKKSEQINM